MRLWWRGRREPLYRHAIGERFRLLRRPAIVGLALVHAVSIGETRAAAALVQTLRARARHAAAPRTARRPAAPPGAALLAPGDLQCWCPVDLPGAVAIPGALQAGDRRADGDRGLAEPPLAAREAGVGMVLANARLSERSLRRGERMAAR